MLRMKLGKRWVGMPSVPPQKICAYAHSFPVFHISAFTSCTRVFLRFLYLPCCCTTCSHAPLETKKMSCAAIGFMVHQQLEPSFKGRPKHEHYRQLLSVIGILLEFENKIQPKNRVFNHIGNYKPYRYSLSGSATSLKRVTVVNSQTWIPKNTRRFNTIASCRERG